MLVLMLFFVLVGQRCCQIILHLCFVDSSESREGREGSRKGRPLDISWKAVYISEID